MPLWKVLAFAVVDGIFWGVVVEDPLKSVILSVLVFIAWMITFETHER